jgi:tRNA(fMet)-specific endonuclease VapC
LLEGNEAVLSNLEQAPEVFVPAIVFGELFFGAAKSSRPHENTVKLEQFAVDRIILPCDLRVAREYRG